MESGLSWTNVSDLYSNVTHWQHARHPRSHDVGLCSSIMTLWIGDCCFSRGWLKIVISNKTNNSMWVLSLKRPSITLYSLWNATLLRLFHDLFPVWHQLWSRYWMCSSVKDCFKFLSLPQDNRSKPLSEDHTSFLLPGLWLEWPLMLWLRFKVSSALSSLPMISPKALSLRTILNWNQKAFLSLLDSLPPSRLTLDTGHLGKAYSLKKWRHLLYLSFLNKNSNLNSLSMMATT